MLLSDLFYETKRAITSNKSRSSLTILGIVIGIGSVIAMVSIGQGAQSSIESSIESIGSNLLMISPGAQRGVGGQVNSGRGSSQTLTMADFEAINSEVTDIGNSTAYVSSRYQVIQKSNNTNTSVYGTTPSYTAVRNIEISEGSFITEQHVNGNAKVAVLGPTTKEDLFGEDGEAIGKTIRINSMNFTVIGITKSKGGSGFNNQDDMIFIPISTAQKFLTGNEYLSGISIQATSQDTLTLVQNQVNSLLMSRHKIKETETADFTILNQSDIVATASSVTGTFTILLGAIAGISLLVGGIGIMNMMLTTVTERTREIGLRKAIGATKANISTQFLTESVMLTFLGGLFGIFFGWVSSMVVTKFFSVATHISLMSILLAFGVSAAIGIIFGYYPARRAAKLNPIDALRYE